MNWLVVIVLALGLLSVGAGPTPAEAACNAKSDGSGRCPFRIEGVNVFDRCFGAPPVGDDAGKATPFGNQACDAIEKLYDVQQKLGKSATDFVNDVKRDLNDFVTVTMRGAYNPQSIATYNRVARYPNQLAKDLDSALKHPVCGSPAALNGLKGFFDQTGQNLMAVGRIGQDVGQAIGALGPAGPEAVKIAQEAGKLASLAANAGQNTSNELAALHKAAQTIYSDLTQLAALDVAGTLAAGVDMVATIGPFLGNCSACAGSLAAAIESLAGGGGATVGGAASCPETAVAFGGGCWAVVAGVPVATLGPVLAGAVATPTCTAATGAATKMAEYAQKIEKFVKTSARLAQSLKSSIDNAVRAGQALAVLAQALGKQAQPSLTAIEASLDRVVDATDQSFDIVQKKVAPATARLAVNVLSQTQQRLDLLFTCYNRYQDLAFRMGGDTVKAMAELSVATTLLVDGGKVADNVHRQSGRAVKAAQEEATERWGRLHKRDRDLYEDLWGVPAYQVDLGKTAAHLAGLNFNKVKNLLDDAIDLGRDRVDALAASLDAGKKAFLDQDKLHASRTKFDEAGVRAANAERMFLGLEGRGKPHLKAAPVFLTPALHTDLHSTIGPQKAKKIKVVR